MNNAIGLFLVFAILVSVVLVTNWQEKTGKKLSDFTWYRYVKWAVIGVVGFSVLMTLVLAIYGAATL
ncbi:hypothetical protein MMIC_P1767 [Mariprofundus micogutta]|uniref:Uncharacterized protein n=1 Tax=Mariprofundus micogutta TaxID=1921010 RepID=A0A1L8CPI7_9PROT|nr:hypothetical protein [Mariprofundus micogutta]GAV20793.1 hypothetical protein MMIC_P1767 [Mariprofundus micogutta]